MNEKKICFISCVNRPEMYKEALFYINRLELPEGFELECICIENARSLASGYNEGMSRSDAKYKVYMHQDVFIINRRFIADLTAVFNLDESLGLIGMCGAEKLPQDAVWWGAGKKYGCVYENHTGSMGRLEFKKPGGACARVEAIDGLLFATQYDIPFRSDLFDGWHFYDVSQCFEFIRKGYFCAVPGMPEPWCIHDCGIVNTGNGYEPARQRFIREYLDAGT
jgi:hypothetical protein